MRLRGATPLPLLGKELLELAARRRTYVIRAAYAAVFFVVFTIVYANWLSRYATALDVLGSGGDMFAFVIALQFATVLLFLPAAVSGVLTYEKERGSLALLFLTDLRPWEILLQKLAGRLVSAFSFLLLSLPLLALAYMLGGVATQDVVAAAWMIALSCLQVGAMALMFSAACRNTVSSFIWTYAFALFMYFGLPLLVGLAVLFCEEVLHIEVTRYLNDDWLFILFPPAVFDKTRGGGFGPMAVWSLPIIVSATLFLGLARFFVVRRAFAQRRSLIVRGFRALDHFWRRAARKILGREWSRRPGSLPDERPVAWRAQHRGIIGKGSHLLYLLILIEVPVGAIGMLAARELSWIGGAIYVSIMVLCLWVVAALAVTVAGASLIPSERTHRTLDVLLATPLSAREIVRDKMRGVYRMILVFAMPLLTLFCIEAVAERGGIPRLALFGSGAAANSREGGLKESIACLVSAVVCLAIYPPMFAWVGCWIGLRVRRRLRAITVALIVLVVWIAGPIFLALLLDEGFGLEVDDPPASAVFLLSPATAVFMAEIEADQFGDIVLDEEDMWPLAVLLNAVWHAGILVYFRRLCLHNAERRLRGTNRVKMKRDQCERQE